MQVPVPIQGQAPLKAEPRWERFMPDILVGGLIFVGLIVWIVIQVGKRSGGPPRGRSGGSGKLDIVDDMVLYDKVNPDDDLLM